MANYSKYSVPHLLGQVNYQGNQKLRPDGDTIHLKNPLLLVNGQAIQPQNGVFKIWPTGSNKPRTVRLKGKPGSYYAPVRFEGLDAPEEHYRANPFKLKMGGQTIEFKKDTTKDQSERSQPMWSPATHYTLNTLEAAGWALVMLDREVTDRYGRVLGYVYASNSSGQRKTFVSLQLVRKGLAFPFLFESAQDLIPTFLNAANQARLNKLGVWKHYQHKPLAFSQTFSAPKKHTDPEPAQQMNAKLNLPMVFRRVVDSHQLKGLSRKLALQKYDAMDYSTGQVWPGDQYHKVPVERLIWAPHSFT